MWANNYIGIPFKYKGRTTDGIDCWGLVRLIYSNEYNITLPSFSSDYSENDYDRISELIVQYKEGWEPIEKPVEGSLVLFRIMGAETHVGIAVSDTHFVHAREGYDSAIESFSSPSWSKRVVGHFKYNQKSNVILNAVPHPLKTQRYTIPIPVGTKLDALATWILKEYSVAKELKSKIHIIVNGHVIDESKWSDTVLTDDDVVEYRAVAAGGDTTRTILTIAVMVVAYVYAGPAGAEAAGWAGGTMTTTQAVAAFAASTATVYVGMRLVDYIAPIRPPAGPENAGSAEQQLMASGAQNRLTPYEAIPVVLGKVRFTPPLGAFNYVTYENERDSYLSMLLTWGYGPLTIDQNTYRIGEQPLSNFTDYNLITLDRKTEPTPDQLSNFNAIYGKDITQVSTNLELVCDGNPEGVSASFSLSSNVCTIYKSNHNLGNGDSIYLSISLDYTWSDPETGATGGEMIDASGTYIVTVNSTNDFSVNISQPNTSGSCNYTPAGPWTEAISTEKVDSLTIALHFPQGLRKIKVKDSNSGKSFAAPTRFDFEYYFNSNWHYLDSIVIGADAPKKDAFTYTKTYSTYNNNIPQNTSGLSVRVRRKTGDNVEDNDNWRYNHISILQNVTFVRNSAPCLDPIGSKIAKTALKIKATDQLNGSIEGINAVVQTYCKSWNGSAWVYASTNNPAALFRYVLEHSANPQKITNPSEKFDLVKLQYWATYCDNKGFTYNSVLGAQRSVLEVLRDICAAGRASPALVDGRWTVTIDEEKHTVIQHFTPHNSWGFESTKLLPKVPDGLRITYFDEDQNYQESEIIVYSVGKNQDNAELFESIQLPGVTKKSAVIDHARWHMAQAKLRPEIYTLNSDIEYLVCNRGDRVKVMHDVPMWGLGSGRIKQRVSGTTLELDETLPMKANTVYSIRIRSASGSSSHRTLLPVSIDGMYNTVRFTEALAEEDANAGDLFMFGEVNRESVDLLILNIEPTNNKSARLTLVDYGVTSTYNIFTDYLSLTENTVFETNITLPPRLLMESFGEKTPTITGSISDETVMEKISDGAFKYNLLISYVNANQLPKYTASVEAQYDYAAATDGLNQRSVFVQYDNGSVQIPDVNEGESYRVRLRYVSSDGRIGNWSDWHINTIVGKTSMPSNVLNLTYEPEFNTGRLRLKWSANPEIDIKGYEVRTEDSNWGSESDRVFYGSATTCSTISESNLISKTYYVRAFDYGNNYSSESATISYTSTVPDEPINLGYTYGTTSNTHSTVTFYWERPSEIHYAIKEYRVTISRPNMPDEIVNVSSTKYITNADWIGNATLKIQAIDVVGSISPESILTVPKYAPNPITAFNADVVDNNVLLKWDLPEKTSSPVSHILIKRGPTWEASDKVIGEKDGTFTTIIELAGGTYTYWLAVVDTDNRESVPVPATVTVSQPPDFIFNAEYISDLNSTMYNAQKLVNSKSILMLVDSGENWYDHFSNNSWANPQEQIDAGYPIYAQPSKMTSYYQEVFDYGQLLSSSSITVSLTGASISGSPEVYVELETSDDNTVWSPVRRLNSLFATNFQYIRVTVRASSGADTDLYQLDKLVVRLDNKQISDSGTVSTVSSDTLGTIVNFNKEFIDVESITLTAAGSTPLTAVYEFKDATLLGEYTVSAGLCTVTITDVEDTNHGLITGQKVRLAFSSGTGNGGIYTVTKINDSQYTADFTGQPDTTGDVVTYSQSMRIYTFKSTDGTRQSTKVGWQIRGY